VGFRSLRYGFNSCRRHQRAGSTVGSALHSHCRGREFDSPPVHMNIDLSPINHVFIHKPLLVGGKAMEYYGLRKAGDDIDFLISREDYEVLAKKYPNNLRDLYKDLEVKIENIELWTSMRLLDYDFHKRGAIELENILVISLEQFLIMKAVTLDVPKCVEDLKLLSKKVNDIQYGKDKTYSREFSDKYNT
jgi:hypothetical protein